MLLRQNNYLLICKKYYILKKRHMEENKIFNQMKDSLSESYIPLVCYHLKDTDKVHLGNKKDKKCRFCGREHPEVTFKMVTHAIPEFTGNKILISEYECDECNGLFSKMETQMSNYMNMYHTAAQVHGKKGVPSYKPNSQQGSKIDLGSEVVNIKSIQGETPIINVDEENKTITYQGHRSYIPQMVFKCLTKMAMTIMPEKELKYFSATLDWLQGKFEYDKNLIVRFRYYPGIRPLPFVSCMLFKRKEDALKAAVPYCLFGLAYSNFVFQIHVPCCENDADLHGKKVDILLIPTPLDFSIETLKLPNNLNFSSNEKVKNEPVSISLSYEKLIEVPVDPEKDKIE